MKLLRLLYSPKGTFKRFEYAGALFGVFIIFILSLQLPSRKVIKPKALKATSSNQVYTWDITYLPTQVKGVFFYLYMVVDIYSRKIVGGKYTVRS